ncbi:hypothetical protein F2Q70_00023427 [Brassica cretica]|uniref:Uncharacterized protein n=1 Tax=Brassica cretica TaxID=69181 RepID=A0A8S9GMU8_BRACR|nr:hypothetical protein F2Q70_00023427 [Brassica cretica]
MQFVSWPAAIDNNVNILEIMIHKGHGAFNELNSRKRGHMKKEISLVSGFLELCVAIRSDEEAKKGLAA